VLALAAGGWVVLDNHRATPIVSARSGSLTWVHQTTANGDLAVPGQNDEQKAAHILDIDNDGFNDFVIGMNREPGPGVVWYRYRTGGWDRYVIESDPLFLEAGGTYHDIDRDGDLDVVMGGDGGQSQVWWWENPYPNYDPGVSWTRRLIKDGGAGRHHDMIFGDFDGDGQAEFVFWNQGATALQLAEIPADPKTSGPWSYRPIYYYTTGIHEGLAKGDIDLDGKLDIVGGGRWYKHISGYTYQMNLIDETQQFTRVAAGQLIPGGRPEVVFVAGDVPGLLKWYQWNGTTWVTNQLLDFEVYNGHSLELGDINGDGHLDIFVAEMKFDSASPYHNPDAKAWFFLGDSLGNFTTTLLNEGYDNHESRLGDLDGDGDLDVLTKPYTWETPRLDIWLNNDTQTRPTATPGPSQTATPTVAPVACPYPLEQWERHVIDAERPWRAVFVEPADLDGDGDQDIVAGAWWYQNPGTPGGVWTRRAIGAPLNEHAIVYDFDKDGDLDILGTVFDGIDPEQPHHGNVFVWARNDGGGTFTVLNNIQPGSARGGFLQGALVWEMAAGNIEVVLSWHGRRSVLQQLTVPADPSTTMWPIGTLSEVSEYEDLSTGDIDRDGDLDLLLGIQWLRNDLNSGGVWTPFTLHITEDLTDRNDLADINQDGRLDAVIGYEFSNSQTKLAWYEQPLDPTSPWTEHLVETMPQPMSVDVADIDKDGDWDVVAGEHNTQNPAAARLYVFENVDSQGNTWGVHPVYTGDEHHIGAQVTDIENDGDLDIISIGWTHGRVLVYEQASCGVLPTPTATSTSTPTVTSTATPGPSPTATPTTTPCGCPSPTATHTATPEPSPTATHTATSEPSPTATHTATPTVPCGFAVRHADIERFMVTRSYLLDHFIYLSFIADCSSG